VSQYGMMTTGYEASEIMGATMSEFPYHKSLRLINFTAFADVELEFTPSINVLIGENGTGKTHVMKAMYAWQVYQSRQRANIYSTLGQLFQTGDLSILFRMGSRANKATVSGKFGSEEWNYTVTRGTGIIAEAGLIATQVQRPVFVPAIDMMGHTKGFLAAANEVVIDFDLTCTDLVALMSLKRKNGFEQTDVPKPLAALLGGTLEYDEYDSRFYLATPSGRMPMPMVAEGIRKVSTLVRLLQNGWLAPGSTLFWDEPEVNVNPVIMDELISAIFYLARRGMQVFLATHSYVILKELDLQANSADNVRFFSLHGSKSGTRVTTATSLSALEPNPISRQYASLYDRDLDRALGKGQRRAAVHRE